jgi:hypothetical protein
MEETPLGVAMKNLEAYIERERENSGRESEEINTAKQNLVDALSKYCSKGTGYNFNIIYIPAFCALLASIIILQRQKTAIKKACLRDHGTNGVGEA